MKRLKILGLGPEARIPRMVNGRKKKDGRSGRHYMLGWGVRVYVCA